MIEVDLVTPVRRLVVGATVESLTLPGADGQIEILPGHRELMTLLGVGALKLGRGQACRSFALSYGFAEVRGDRVKILAETAEESTEIDVERAKRAQSKAEHAMKGAMTPSEFAKYKLKLDRALIRQQVASKSG